MSALTYDIIIVGSGIVGATAAITLAKNTSLKIAIIDAQHISVNSPDQEFDHRVSAISQASQRIFKNLNVWEKMRAKRVSAYTHMHVWQELDAAKIDFDSAHVNADVLGFIIEDSVMRSSLYEAFSSYPHLHLHHAVALTTLREKSDCIELITADEQIYSAKLIIGADGANSWVRKQMDVALNTYEYGHTAIVATVKTQMPHEATARQRFLTTGPLAFLPLSEPHTASIVWSTTDAEKLLALDDAEFKKTLSNAFEHRLGNITDVAKRYHFPLKMRHAKNYVKSRMALIGDAAHTIHPLAGQGVNLGLLDAACLTQVIIDTHKKQRDYASFITLRRYERWRKGDNLAMLKMVEVLKYLFMSDKSFIQLLRNVGLSVTDRYSFLKNFFTNYALGNQSDLPEIASK